MTQNGVTTMLEPDESRVESPTLKPDDFKIELMTPVDTVYHQPNV